MPKVQIDVPDDAYKQLKNQAKDDDRSLTKYLVRGLVYLASIPGGYHSVTTPVAATQPTPTEYNGRKIKSIVYEKETPAPSKEEQEISKLKLQQKKDDLRQKRVDYFKKKYKEIFGEFSMPNREVTTGLTTCRT